MIYLLQSYSLKYSSIQKHIQSSLIQVYAYVYIVLGV